MGPKFTFFLCFFLGFFLLWDLGAAEDESKVWNFDSDRTDGVPRGLSVEVGEWRVALDPSAPSGSNVLAQVAKSSRPVFNLALVEGTRYGDLDLSVKMKSVAGEIDRGGGVVFRAKDKRNYYIARFNPLEDNYRVYKVEDGKRIQLQSADLAAGEGWLALRVTMKGDHIQCYLNGKKHLDVKDDLFKEPGRIGLWTKADAQTHFDDLTVSGLRGSKLDAQKIGEAAGTAAAAQPDGVVRIAWARTEVRVRVDGMPFKPFAGLGSWAAFQETGQGAMVMGDTVVFQDEVTPAIDAAFASGLEVTALHNHFFYDEPRVYFMHIGGRGDPEKLASAVKAVWDAIKKVRAERVEPATRFEGVAPEAGSIDAQSIEEILGQKSQSQDGVIKVTIGRRGTMDGVEMGGSMGLTTWAAFSGSDELAAVDGDFIMTAEEVQPVLRALRRERIHVVALHSHMIGEKPSFYFTHFWGKGPAKDLARGIKAALLAQESALKGAEGH